MVSDRLQIQPTKHPTGWGGSRRLPAVSLIVLLVLLALGALFYYRETGARLAATEVAPAQGGRSSGAQATTPDSPASESNRQQEATTRPDTKFFAAIQIEDAQEESAPLTIGGQDFTVIIRKKRLVWPAEAQHKFSDLDDETAVAVEIRDAQSRVVYSRESAGGIDLAEVRKQGSFGDTNWFYHAVLQGAVDRALMVSWGGLPSAPDACDTHVVLGLFEGKLVPFSDEFCAHVVEETVDDRQMVRLQRDQVSGGDVFHIRERQAWGNFSAIIPIRVDFLLARLRPARVCRRAVGPAQWDELCEFRVEAERHPEQEETFVRLFPEPYADRVPQHVVVKPASKVELLSCLALNLLDANGKWKPVPQASEAEAPQPWLQVIIDGKRGWVRDQEDLMALGLPPVG